MPGCGIRWKKTGFPEAKRKGRGAVQRVKRQGQLHMVVFPDGARAGIGAERIHIRRGEYGANRWRKLTFSGLGGLH